MNDYDYKSNLIVGATIVMIVLIIVLFVLGGQALRNHRAEVAPTMAGEYTQTITAPGGYGCTGFSSSQGSNVFIVQCYPKH